MPARRSSSPGFALALVLAALVLVFVLPRAARAAESRTKVILNGVAVPVSFNDGDTFRILAGANNGSSARLAGFNTLESYGAVHQWGGWTAKEMFVLAKMATYHSRLGVWHCTTDGSVDGYNRLLAICPDLAESLVRQGFAHALSVDDKPSSPELIEAQKDAQRNRRGIWAHGVPPFVLTSLHSIEEDLTGDGTYNRLVSSEDGHSVMWQHDDRYAECAKVCHMVYEADPVKVDEVVAALSTDPKAAKLIRGVSASDLLEAVGAFAKWRNVSRAIPKDNRYDLEKLLHVYVGNGAFGPQRASEGSCMTHVPFERRYGGGRAACLQ